MIAVKSNLFALSLPFILLLFFQGYTKNSERLTMSSHFGDEEYRSAATLFQSFVFSIYVLLGGSSIIPTTTTISTTSPTPSTTTITETTTTIITTTTTSTTEMTTNSTSSYNTTTESLPGKKIISRSRARRL